MSLAAMPAFFLARRVVGDGSRAARGAHGGGDSVPRVHGHGDDRERVLPALPARDARSRRRARATDAAARRRCSSRSSGSRSRPASRRSRSRRRSCSRRSCSPCSSGAASRRRSRKFRWLYGIVAGAAVAVLAFQLGVGRAARRLLARRRSLATTSATRFATSGGTSPSSRSTCSSSRSRRRSSSSGALARSTRGCRRSSPRRVSLTVCIVPVVAIFASEFSDRIEERNMFYVAPLFCIALLAWVERGAPRPRVLAASRGCRLRAARRRDPVRPLPHDVCDHGHAHAAAVLVAAGPDRRGLDHDSRRSGSRRRSLPRFSSCPAGTRSRCRCSCSGSGSSRSGRSGGGRTDSSASRAVRSSRGSVRRIATGSIGRCRRRTRRVPLDGTHRPAHREPERVLQPRGRAGVLRHRPDAGWPSGDACSDRSENGRRDAPERRARARPLPPRRLVVRAGRQPDRAGQGVGCDALACPVAARLRGEDRRPVSERHVVGRRGHVHPAPLHSRDGCPSRSRATRASSSSRRRSSRDRTAASSGGCDCSLRGERC